MRYCFVAVGIILTVVVALSQTGWAQEKPPQVGSEQSLGKVGPEVKIDKILSGNSIIIGDVHYRISPEARFYTKDGRTKLSFSALKEGDRIVVLGVGPNGEIQEMWIGSE